MTDIKKSKPIRFYSPEKLIEFLNQSVREKISCHSGEVKMIQPKSAPEKNSFDKWRDGQ